MKRIAIFCDGTWNTPDEQKDGKPCQTNVVKMANALCENSVDGTVQKLYYDSGIGSEGGILKRMYDGATGTGISKNILQAYSFLMNTYEPGDELFLFGFSRGAFTVRSLSGFIRNAGIMDMKFMDKLPLAYNLYKSRHPSFNPKAEASVLFRKTYAVEDVTGIKFIGVFDTVGALGNPLFLKGVVSEHNEFHDTELSSKIENAYHALAIDEKRRNFQATLWHQQKSATKQVLEQVWFAGVHSDVGGGYPESDLSDVPLQWMTEKAEGCKLHFDPIPAAPNSLGTIHESFKGIYHFGGKLYRPIGKSTPGLGATNEKVHPSAIERHEKIRSYRPKNLNEYLARKSKHSS